MLHPRDVAINCRLNRAFYNMFKVMSEMFFLLDCPFCGGRPSIIRTGDNKQSCIIECENCGCRLESNEAGHGKAWNRRVIDGISKQCYADVNGQALKLIKRGTE
jgi:Lar family restriction alleviation protein